MKLNTKIGALLLMFVIIGCSTDNTTVEEEQEMPVAVNQSPSMVTLISPSNQEVNVDVRPTFSWEAATDPDGDTITYEVYADTSINPTTLMGTTTNTSFEIVNRFSILENYNWKVVAVDTDENESVSTINNFDTRNLVYENALENTPFLERAKLASAVFQNKVWISGGVRGSIGNNEVFSDIWSSEDGITWEQVVTNAPWGERFGHTMLVFQGKLWVMGGFGEMNETVWSSTDGIHWDFVTNFGESLRSYIVFQDKLWMIGGSQVVNSTNGEDWSVFSQGNIGLNRFGHTSVVFDNRMWIIGSDFDSSFDVRSSSDGITWTIENENPPFEQMPFGNFGKEFSSVIFDNKMWVIGGRLNPNRHSLWYSENGQDWELATDNAAFSERGGHGCVVFEDKIWLIGGRGLMSNYLNDVWLID